jgi:adenylate cyclase
LAGGGTVLMLYFGIFGNLQAKFSDLLFAPRPTSGNIIIVAIDDKSIQKIGRWPWDRKVFAVVLEKLTSAAAIGIDVTFSETSNDDGIFRQALLKNPQTVLAAEDNAGQKLLPAESLRSVTSWGIVNLFSDSDNVVRRARLNDSFSAEILKKYYSATGGRELIPTGNIFINYAGGAGYFPTVSLVDILEGAEQPDFAGKIILIGATAPDLHDEVLTPVSHGKSMAGVEAHANILDTVLTGKYLNPERQTVTGIQILVLVLIISLVWGLKGMRAGIALSVAAVIGYLLSAYMAFDRGIVRGGFYVLFAIISSTIFSLIYRYISLRKQKQFIQKAFGNYVSKPVMKEIIRNPKSLKLGGEKRKMTVLFSDIAGFTTLSENLPPEKLSKALNAYLSRMTEVVFKNNGVVDKFIGDAVMAFWGAPISDPDHAYNACKAALEMQDAIDEIRPELENLGFGKFSVRIGINSGDMTVGNMGSDSRFDYTVLGDNVNLSSRLEGLNKEYETKILIGEGTHELVKDKIGSRLIDTVAVKGKKTGVKVYELLSLRAPMKSGRGNLAFEQALSAYQKGQFKTAGKLFANFLKSNPADGPSKTFVNRCRQFMAEKPENWDGIYRATSK